MHVLVRRRVFLTHASKKSCYAFNTGSGRQRLQTQRYNTTKPKNFSDYDSLIHFPKPHIPPVFNFAKDVLDVWETKEKAAGKSSWPALWWVNDRNEEIKWSFEELGFYSRQLANILLDECGLVRGDRVLLILPRVPEWWLVNIACLRTGTVLIPGTSQLTARDILHRLQVSQAKCLITDEHMAPLIETVTPQCPTLHSKLLVSDTERPGWGNLTTLMRSASAKHVCVDTRSDEPMTIFFTSGTTGAPKMTVHSHCSYGLGLTVNGRYWLDLTDADVFWNTSDTGWAKSAWSSVFAPWIQGACVFIHHMPRFDTNTVLETLCRYPINTFCTAPTAYRMLVQEDASRFQFQALEHCLCAGEPINPEVMKKWRELTGLDIYEGYGQTETVFTEALQNLAESLPRRTNSYINGHGFGKAAMVLIAGTFKGMEIRPGSFGKASPAYDVQVINEEGNIVARGTEGNLAIRVKPDRPFSLFTEYLGEPEKTAECFCGDFYLTGDRGIMDQDGYLWFVGRADDVILSAGYRIGPFEVENALIEHEAVAEAAVVSSPDPVRGEVVKAFVMLTSEYKHRDQNELITQLQTHVKKVTAPYKYPRKIEFVDHLPKTVSGKIRRVELRKKEWRLP